MDKNNYDNILYYLSYKQLPKNLTPTQQESLRKQSTNYQIHHNFLYKIDQNTKRKIRVVQSHEMEVIVYMFHNDPLSAHASTERMINKMKTRYYWPEIIQTDRGTHFNNQLLEKLLEKFKIEHLMSTPYHPQTNGLVKRFNRTLIEALSRAAAQHLDKWDKYVAPMLFSYRISKHATTRLSPFFLVYGREAKLLTDDTKIEEKPSLVHHLAQQLDELPIWRKETQIQIAYKQQKQKDRYDEKINLGTQFQIGDLVLYYRAMLDK